MLNTAAEKTRLETHNCDASGVAIQRVVMLPLFLHRDHEIDGWVGRLYLITVCREMSLDLI